MSSNEINQQYAADFKGSISSKRSYNDQYQYVRFNQVFILPEIPRRLCSLFNAARSSVSIFEPYDHENTPSSKITEWNMAIQFRRLFRIFDLPNYVFSQMQL